MAEALRKAPGRGTTAEQFMEAYSLGGTQTQIGIRLGGITKQAVSQLMKKYRLEPYKGRKVSPEQIREAHDQRLSGNDVENVLPISSTQYYSKLRKLDLEPNADKGRKARALFDVQYIAANWMGLSTAAAAKALGISQSAVVYNWRRLGLSSNFKVGRPRKAAEENKQQEQQEAVAPEEKEQHNRRLLRRVGKKEVA